MFEAQMTELLDPVKLLGPDKDRYLKSYWLFIYEETEHISD